MVQNDFEGLDLEKLKNIDFEPSEKDIALTKRLIEAGKIVGIEVIDHLIVSRNGHFSFQAEGILRGGI